MIFKNEEDGEKNKGFEYTGALWIFIDWFEFFFLFLGLFIAECSTYWIECAL